ncbi:MAG: CotH kinase family protein [Christensenellaceae bacterium]|nr:CotH kinase family protein [Christensenellaceae bacterium]
MKKQIVSIAIIILLAGVLVAAILGAFNGILGIEPQDVPEGTAPGLYINEVVTSNKYSLEASDGSTPDWVEIYNCTGSNINLKDYGLTDDTTDRYKFTFPGMTIKNGEYMIVYLTGTEDLSNPDGILRAGFKLSKDGSEILVLSGPEDHTIQALEIGSMPADVSYGRADDGSYLYYALSTPGAKNEGISNTVPTFSEAVVESDLVINEYVIDNQYSVMDEDGDRPEWVEIKNTGSEAIDLKGYGLSDDPSDTKKWIFPEMQLQPGEIRLVFLSKKDKVDPAGELHASFSIGEDDTQLFLSQPQGLTVDVVDLDPAMGTASHGRTPDDPEKWQYYPEATPGAENTTKGFDQIDVSGDRYLPEFSISEVKTNSTVKEKTPDWIELVNTGSQPIELEGYGLSDDKDEPFLFTFPAATLQPGEYVLVYTDGSTAGQYSAPFAVSAQGNTVYLSRPDGSIIDYMDSGVQYAGMSAGRPQGTTLAERVYFTEPTPGAANAAETYKTYTQKPTFSLTGGYVAEGTAVTISSENGATIYYTTDGSKPTTKSQVYTGPVTISKTTSLRAMATVSGKLNSEVKTENYLVEDKHSIPVMCISGDPNGLFGYYDGIMADGPGHTHDAADFPFTGANFFKLKEEEREISVEWFEADGTKGVEFPAGIKIYGQFSRACDQKSVALYLRSSYGQSEVTYPFFRDYDVTTFSSLVLRISGQDGKYTKLRDSFFQQVVKDTMDLDYQEYRPCAVYINGQYWGLYNLREKLNESYVTTHYEGTDEDHLDIIKGNSDVKSGSRQDFQELCDYIRAHDLSDPEAYEYVCSKVDVDEYMDYIITETFFNNTDSGNVRFWRATDEGSKYSKYRWMLFDLDWGVFNGTYKWNYIEEYFNPQGHGIGHGFTTAISCGLLENPEWKEKFIERYAWHLNNTFDPDRMEAILDAMVAEIEPEMPRHIDRWGKASMPDCAASPASMEVWENNVASLKRMLREKVDITKADLQEFFNLSDARMKELNLM